MKSVFLSNLHHAYAQTDGTYAFPNSREGDMLKTAKREIESIQLELSEAYAEMRKQTGHVAAVFDHVVWDRANA